MARQSKEELKRKAHEYYLANRDHLIAKARTWHRTSPKRKQWLEDNKERLRAASKQWARDNPEKRKAQKVRYGNKNRERIRFLARKRYHSSADVRKKIADDARVYRAANRELVAAKIRQNRNDNRERFRAQRAVYRDKYRDKVNGYVHARRARKRGSGGRYTAHEWRTLLTAWNHRCVKCGACGKMTPDHIVPIALGGSNNIDNIQPMCLPCNIEKGVKIVDYRVNYSSALAD